MPELPEVETIVRSLRPVVVGKQITSVVVHDELLCAPVSADRVCAVFVGQTVADVVRKGKYIVMRLANGVEVGFHLRMTGQMVYDDCSSDRNRVRFEVRFLGGGKLSFCDVRRLGKLHLDVDRHVERLGPDPFSNQFREWFCEQVGRRKAPIKTVLLNQRVAAGVGNIYADESLFRAGIKPDTRAHVLTDEQKHELGSMIVQVLDESIRCCGTSFSDYVDGRGVRGEFSEQLFVYGRKGEMCRRCGSNICHMKIGGRSSYYCPRCQM